MKLLTVSFIFISSAYFPFCLAFTKQLPRIGWGSVPSNTVGWQSSPPSSSITGAAAGGSGSLIASQDTDLAQTFSFQATGEGMNINFTSNMEGIAGADLGANGAIANVESTGTASAVMNETTVSTILAPAIQLGLDIDGANTVDINVASHTFGWEHIDADVTQGAQVTSGNYTGGWKE